MTITTDVWKKGGEYGYGAGWSFKAKGEVSLDEENKVLYIEIEGEKFGLDTEDARRIFNFFLTPAAS